MTCRYAVLTVLALMSAAPATAQKSEKAADAAKGTPLTTSAYLDALRRNTTTAGKVAMAVAAGPEEISRDAAVIEIISPTESKTLRAGTNGWTCIANPHGPMCVDATFMAWAGAWMNKLEPNTTKVGFAYMLLGDDGASLSDPHAKTPTADWVKSGAHTMLILPDAKLLEGLSTDPKAGGPYVMWKGTPYAHVMVPGK